MPAFSKILRAAAAGVIAITPLRTSFAQSGRTAAVVSAVGMREGRGYSTLAGALITATATDDGLVEIVVASDTTHRPYRSREPRITRAFYPPAAISAWLAGVDTLRQAVAGAIPFGRLSRTVVSLRDGDAVGFHATASDNSGQRHLSLSIQRCRGDYVRNRGVDEKDFPALVATLAAAAADARRVPNAGRRSDADARVFYEHAVGCTADPMASNPPPDYPHTPIPERHRRAVLTRFVVDTTGLVEPGSVAFARTEDPRFAAAARSALSRWRFTKATRRGVPVRQLSHLSIVFDPPLGDSVERGCSMAAGSGVIARPLTSGALRTLEPAYLTHVAARFAIWLNHPGVVGASVRLVVHRDGRFSDVSVDRLPADTVGVRDFRTRLQLIPFGFDPLPPTFPSEAVALQVAFVAKCASPRTAMFWGQPTTVAPLADGLMELANLHPAWESIFDTREPPPSRDVVPADALEFFLDTTQTLLPAADVKFPAALDRWSGSLAEVPILGYRGTRGLVLGLGTQGQLHGDVACGEGGERLNVRREDLPEFWRIAREALALRGSSQLGTDRSPGRVYDESEVACAALPAVGNEPVLFPSTIVGRARFSHEVLVSLTVDTLGAVQPRSVATFPGTDARFTAAVRAVAPRWRFRPALRGGRRVAQRLHLAIVVRPPEADAAVLVAKPSMAADTSTRTIFFQRP
jgi:hypothetical protein